MGREAGGGGERGLIAFLACGYPRFSRMYIRREAAPRGARGARHNLKAAKAREDGRGGEGGEAATRQSTLGAVPRTRAGRGPARRGAPVRRPLVLQRNIRGGRAANIVDRVRHGHIVPHDNVPAGLLGRQCLVSHDLRAGGGRQRQTRGADEQRGAHFRCTRAQLNVRDAISRGKGASWSRSGAQIRRRTKTKQEARTPCALCSGSALALLLCSLLRSQSQISVCDSPVILRVSESQSQAAAPAGMGVGASLFSLRAAAARRLATSASRVAAYCGRRLFDARTAPRASLPPSACAKTPPAQDLAAWLRTMAFLRHLALYLWKNAIQKARNPGQLCV